MIGIFPKLTCKRIVVGIPIILIGLFLLISAIGWLRDWRENPRLVEQNEQRAQQLRMRARKFPESMPFEQFIKAFPEAELDQETGKYCIVVPNRFKIDNPTYSDSFSRFEFEVNNGEVKGGYAGGIIVCGYTVKGVLYYFFRAWSSQEDFDYRLERDSIWAVP